MLWTTHYHGTVQVVTAQISTTASFRLLSEDAMNQHSSQPTLYSVVVASSRPASTYCCHANRYQLRCMIIQTKRQHFFFLYKMRYRLGVGYANSDVQGSGKKWTKQMAPQWPPRSWVLPEKLTVYQVVKKYPVFYRTLRFITVFTPARHLSPPSARFRPCPPILRFIHVQVFHVVLSLMFLYQNLVCTSFLPTRYHFGEKY